MRLLLEQPSTSEGTITRYRGNPVQNIQQLLDYADADRTIGDFLDQLSTSFMTAIPKSTVGYNPQNITNPTLDRRNLIKNIRELYRLKELVRVLNFSSEFY